MTIAETIREKLAQSHLSPRHLEVVNESHMHSVPKGSETHFKVLVVSEAFAGMGPVERHRAVNSVLQVELKNGVHALSLRTLTPSQWGKETLPFESPACLGGSKAASSPEGGSTGASSPRGGSKADK
ncbi:MAG: BolA family protein [Polyangiaceae bacterium]